MTSCKTSEMFVRLLKLFMGHNWTAHEHKLKVMDEMFSVWIEKYK